MTGYREVIFVKGVYTNTGSLLKWGYYGSRPKSGRDGFIFVVSLVLGPHRSEAGVFGVDRISKSFGIRTNSRTQPDYFGHRRIQTTATAAIISFTSHPSEWDTAIWGCSLMNKAFDTIIGKGPISHA